MEILIISGLSGSGKSRAATYLEDVGYYTVDNLPAEMMLRFADFCAAAGGRYDKLAFVYDVRVGETPENLTAAVSQLVVLDTSAFSTAKLRSTLLSIFAASGGALHVNVLSFGFKNGLPPEADLVLDVRFLPNPYYVPELKSLNGLDAPVRDYVFHSEQTDEFFRRLTPLLDFLLPQYRQEGRTELVIAVGCTGGRHRSVAVAHYLAEYVTRLGCDVTESHRDMTR